MKISEVAERCEVNVQTIRFYERRGLLRDPRNGVGGYRDYDDADVERLQFIRQPTFKGSAIGPPQLTGNHLVRAGGGPARRRRGAAARRQEAAWGALHGP